MNRTTNALSISIDVAEDDRLRIHVQIKRERSRQCRADWLDAPARVGVHVTENLLDQHQTQDRQPHRCHRQPSYLQERVAGIEVKQDLPNRSQAHHYQRSSAER
jgi:hypothetical protein